MLRVLSSSAASDNRLLAALPPSSFQRIAPHGRLVSAALDDVIDAPGTRVSAAHFPTTAVLSMLCKMDDGALVEFGMIGNEGTTALAMCLGVPKAAPLTIVQVAGDSFRLPAAAIRDEFERGEVFHDLLLRYLYAFLAQISQSVGCNTHHLLEARLSRWLLIVHDRVEADELRLKHEFLSQMLGTGRSAVTIAAGALRRAGLIRYTRGKITVLDRAGLEASSCECYGIVRAAFAAAQIG